MQFKAVCPTVLKKLNLQSRDPNNQVSPILVGRVFSGAIAATEKQHHKVVLDYGAGTWWIFIPHWQIVGQDDLLSLEQSIKIFGRVPSAGQLKDLNDCLKRFKINTKARMTHFLSQVAHESGGLRWLREIDSGTQYEGRHDLGNVNPGDGRKYKGAGAIQLTGRNNYQSFANFVKDQEVMQGVNYVVAHYPFAASGYWWYQNNMNALCDRPNCTVKMVTRRVNGGYRGLEDREQYYKKCLEVLS